MPRTVCALQVRLLLRKRCEPMPPERMQAAYNQTASDLTHCFCCRKAGKQRTDGKKELRKEQRDGWMDGERRRGGEGEQGRRRRRREGDERERENGLCQFQVKPHLASSLAADRRAASLPLSLCLSLSLSCWLLITCSSLGPEMLASAGVEAQAPFLSPKSNHRQRVREQKPGSVAARIRLQTEKSTD